MTGKIRRRFKVVKLYQGEYEQQLEELKEQIVQAEGDRTRSQRFGSAPTGKADALAEEHDALLAEAEQDAVEVTVYALGFREFEQLSDDHPPREDDKRDASFGVNMKSFPEPLALAALGNEPIDGTRLTVEQMTEKGTAVLNGLGDISRVHWLKIERAAWDVNTSSDELPKSSAVSLLARTRERSSKSPSDSESVLDD